MKDGLLLQAFLLRRYLPLKSERRGDKGKEKVGSSVWANTGVAMARAKEPLTPDKVKEISNMPSHEMASQHVHKLVQVIFSYLVLTFALSLSFWLLLLTQVLMALFTVRCWEKRCTSLLNIW